MTTRAESIRSHGDHAGRNDALDGFAKKPRAAYRRRKRKTWPADAPQAFLDAYDSGYHDVLKLNDMPLPPQIDAEKPLMPRRVINRII